ncbi:MULTISPECIES: NUDIX hydrolase [Nocardiopsis]|uniref:NUDIX hydrolase n=1 Tax=Nocardiopsis lambiniae TaxID=3075539 RepID=A0ABU2M4H3_9ACTN|nr:MULTISPECIES: NUDIX hydrolase [unclassified Nocardiopsis]MDE3719931.1 NUDIX hydrolase [Nocardiopsis sp. N85]MDT0327554.1 NUDIX hydrolase [Nocardiopsis sp. DSM 44743]
MNASLTAAGGLISRPGDSGPEFVVIHRPRYDDWSFPKGKVDPGETLEQTALREVWEETALRCRLGRRLGSMSYPGKVVHYWSMTVEEADVFEPSEEVDAVRWVPASEAESLLSHPQDRELLGLFLSLRAVE